MLLWLNSLGNIALLILKIFKLLMDEKGKKLVNDLSNAKTDEEKQAALNAVSSHLFQPPQ